MKITGISVYQVDIPLKDGTYKWSDDKFLTTFDSTVVRVDTDAGITGYGEVTPCGPNYMPSYAAGVRAGIRELGPHLIGQDPCELGVLNAKMDYCLKGHEYVKSPIDMACWDILGKVSGLPVCTLLGGRYGDSVRLYRSISQDTPDKMAARALKYKQEGYTMIMLKVGGDPNVDIERIRTVRQVLDPADVLIADANTGWLPHQALKVASAVSDLDVFIEQPCLTYDECMYFRDHSNKPLSLDETIDDVTTLVKAHHQRACDVVNLKISRFGGLTKTKQARDLCVTFGLAMTLEDTWGGDISTAAIAHLAHSTPEKYRFSSNDFNSYNTVCNAEGSPRRVNGGMSASTGPGLGVEPIMTVLGDPVFTV